MADTNLYLRSFNLINKKKITVANIYRKFAVTIKIVVFNISMVLNKKKFMFFPKNYSLNSFM